MTKLYQKILEFQKKVNAIPKTEENPYFKSMYADINQFIKIVKPILNEVGLIIMQPLTMTAEGKPVLETLIADVESGEFAKSNCPLPENTDPQKMGAIITYFRRYSLQSLLLLEAEDVDGDIGQNKNLNRTVSPPMITNPNDLPFIGKEFALKPASTGTCPDCGAEKVFNPKTSKYFCKNKCWLKK